MLPDLLGEGGATDFYIANLLWTEIFYKIQ